MLLKSFIIKSGINKGYLSTIDNFKQMISHPVNPSQNTTLQQNYKYLNNNTLCWNADYQLDAELAE